MAKKKRKSRLILYIVIGIMVFYAIASAAGWTGGSKAVEVQTTEVMRRNIIQTVAADGVVMPETEVKISADVSGEIVELLVEEGQQVEANQLLLVIDPQIIQAATEQAEATLNQSKANLSNARSRVIQAEVNFNNLKINYERNKKLFEKQTISALEFETISTQYETAKAELEAARQTVTGAEFNVKSLEASLKQARDNLRRTRIYAPMAGTVSKLNVKKGERVVGTAQMSGTELLRIADLSVMEVNVKVNESDIVRIHQGDTALVEIEAFPKKQFKGIVKQIASSSNDAANALVSDVSDKVTKFDVKVLILASSLEEWTQKGLNPLRPGMSASVEIQCAMAIDVLSVPIQAVTTRKAEQRGKKNKEQEVEEANNEKSDEEFVFVIEQGKASQKVVKTGIQDNKFIEIVEGLSEGETIINGPYSAISKTLKLGDIVKSHSESNKSKD